MKTSNKLLLGLLIVILLGATAFVGAVRYYGTGNAVTQNRDVSPFTEIEVKGNLRVYITQQAGHSLEIRAADNLLELVNATVSDGVLHLKLTQPVKRDERVEIHVSAETIRGLTFAEGALVQSTGELRGDELKIKGNSGGQTNLTLHYAALEVNASSGVISQLEGEVADALINGYSGTIINAAKLRAGKCAIAGNQGTVTHIHVSDELSATLTGGSVLTYTGEPVVRSLKTSGGGVVNKK
jgi:hypothetical protein